MGGLASTASAAISTVTSTAASAGSALTSAAASGLESAAAASSLGLGSKVLGDKARAQFAEQARVEVAAEEWRRHTTHVQEELHHACTENDFDLARPILVSMIAEGGSERLNSMLQAEDEYGQSPLRIAATASGRSDTGDPSLKLLLLTCLHEIGATEDLFR